jgi:hypothetical protein
MFQGRLLAYVILTAGLLTFGLLPRAGSQQQQKEAEGPFEGKVLQIYVKGYQGPAATLEKVRVRQLGDRSFLVGKELPAPGERQSEATTWISVNEVTLITEYANRDQFRRAVGLE